MKILFVIPRFPYPPIKGDKLRVYHQIRHLSKKHSITLATFAENRNELRFLDELKKFCKKIEVVIQTPVVSYTRVALNFFSKLPLTTFLYKSSSMKRKINKLIRDNDFDLIHTQLIRMAPYTSCADSIPGVLDMIDALSSNMKMRFENERFFMKPFFYFEWKRTRGYEKEVCSIFDKVVVATESDKSQLLSNDNVIVCPNGVDSDYFYYANHKERDPFSLIFVGNMGYFPNIHAVQYFTTKIYPLIKKHIPQVRFHIVGANPPKTIRNIASQYNDIIVTDYVIDIRKYLSKATIAVCPLQSGTGIQNKVLEAMSMGIPVVGTKFSVSGIEAIHDQDIIIADSPENFAESVVNLLTNKMKMLSLSLNGRNLVVQKYSWERSISILEKTYEKVIEEFKYRAR